MIVGMLMNLVIGFVLGLIFLFFFPRAPAWVIVMVVMIIGWLAAVYQLWGP